MAEIIVLECTGAGGSHDRASAWLEVIDDRGDAFKVAVQLTVCTDDVALRVFDPAVGGGDLCNIRLNRDHEPGRDVLNVRHVT